MLLWTPARFLVCCLLRFCGFPVLRHLSCHAIPFHYPCLLPKISPVADTVPDFLAGPRFRKRLIHGSLFNSLHTKTTTTAVRNTTVA